MGDLADATREEIAGLHVAEIAPGLAQLAITLAETIDAQDGLTGRANAGRELRAVMNDLRKLAPVAVEGDGVDGITGNRAERRAKLRAVPAAGE
jgi:hypothetical protein